MAGEQFDSLNDILRRLIEIVPVPAEDELPPGQTGQARDAANES